MEPYRVRCYCDEKGHADPDSFLIGHTPNSIIFSDVPEEFRMSKEQLADFIRVLNIRLQKIS